ncbi:hypothetical protein [Thauera butanivorans]|uniref:hypothetical protein n=1 Tax=Thauera butanivorans TaxID=86174 RepID=UPI000839685D|nr:hypothetical protein [Thauera butanivorans]
MVLLRKIISAARRLRLQAAEADLAFLEARAPLAIADQRARVDQLRAKEGLPPVPSSADAIRRDIERATKAAILRI